MYRNIQRWRVAVLSLLLLALVGGIFAAHAQDSNVLRIAVVTPQVLDPAQGSNDSEVLFNRSIYDYLVETLPDKTIAPNLATDWEVSDDGLTYTFNLAQGVTFHDGSPFTSADVVFTFNRLKELESAALSILGDFEVSAPDDSTVVFTLPEANVSFLNGVSNRFALILKDGTETPNVIADGDNPYVNFNGTGPFVLTDYDAAAGTATLTKNENYWKDGQPLLDGVQFVFIDDPATQVNALRGGQVDYVYKIPNDLVATLQGDDTISIMQKATNQHPVIRLRADEAPGDNPMVQQAFKYATDRDQLNQIVNQGLGVVGNNDPIGPGFGIFYDDQIQNPGYDPEMACSLLSQAGYPDGLDLDLYVPTALGYDTLLAPALKEQWEPACIRIEIQAVSEGDYYNDAFANNWLTATLGITPWSDQDTPQGYLVQAYITGGVWNESRWSDPEIDQLVAQAGTTDDIDARAQIYHQISEIFAERGPIIVPFFASIFGATSSSVQGLDMPNFPGLTDLRGVSLSS